MLIPLGFDDFAILYLTVGNLFKDRHHSLEAAYRKPALFQEPTVFDISYIILKVLF